jgi:thermostable 8-oxoguanine DNA glycosylase
LVARTVELGIRLSIDMSDGVIEDRNEELKKKVKIIHEESKERQDKYLLEQANISEDADDKMKAKALRLMRLRERQGRAYNKFAYQQRGGSRGGGIN